MAYIYDTNTDTVKVPGGLLGAAASSATQREPDNADAAVILRRLAQSTSEIESAQYQLSAFLDRWMGSGDVSPASGAECTPKRSGIHGAISDELDALHIRIVHLNALTSRLSNIA